MNRIAALCLFCSCKSLHYKCINRSLVQTVKQTADFYKPRIYDNVIITFTFLFCFLSFSAKIWSLLQEVWQCVEPLSKTAEVKGNYVHATYTKGKPYDCTLCLLLRSFLNIPQIINT